MKGKLSGFSTERLFRFLNALGCDVEIVVKNKQSNSEAKTKVFIDKKSCASTCLACMVGVRLSSQCHMCCNQPYPTTPFQFSKVQCQFSSH